MSVPEQNLKRKLKRALPWAVAESIASAFFTLLTTVTAARLITAHDFGRASIVLAIVTVIQSLFLIGPSNAVIRAPKLDTSQSDSAFWLLCGLGLIGALMTAGMAGPVSAFYDDIELRGIMLLAATCCLIEGLISVPTAILARKMRTKKLAIRNVSQRATTFVITGSCAYYGLGAWAILIGQISGQFVAAFVVLAQTTRLPSLRFSVSEASALLRLGLSVGMELVAGVLAPRLVMLLFARFHGLEAVGYLNFAVRLIDEVCNLLKVVMTRTALPVFSQIKRQGGSLKLAFQRGTKITSLIASPVLMGLAAVSSDLVPMIFGERWQNSVYAIQVVAFCWCIALSRILMPPLLLAEGRQFPQTINSWLAVTIGIITAVAFQDLSYPTSTWSYAVPILGTIPTGIWMSYRVSSISPREQCSPVIGPIISSLMMMVAINVCAQNLAYTDRPLRLILLVGLGVGWQLGYILLFHRDVKNEIIKALK